MIFWRTYSILLSFWYCCMIFQYLKWSSAPTWLQNLSDSVLCFYLLGGESHCYVQTVWSFTPALPSLIKQKRTLPLIAGFPWTLPAEGWLIAALVFLLENLFHWWCGGVFWIACSCLRVLDVCWWKQTNCYLYALLIMSVNSLLLTTVNFRSGLS